MEVAVLCSSQAKSFKNDSGARMSQDALKEEGNVRFWPKVSNGQLRSYASIVDERHCMLSDNVATFLKFLQEDLSTIEHN